MKLRQVFLRLALLTGGVLVVSVPAAQAQESSVTVTPTHVMTHMDKIPRLCNNPTITAIRSGLWSDANTWSTGQVPGEGARVQIGAGLIVNFRQTLSERVACIEVAGRLSLSPLQSTHLRVGTLMVLPGGTLQIGTPASPIPAAQKAEITFIDTPLQTGTVQSPGPDPQQYGNGLIAFGIVSIHGAPKNITWARLTQEPRAGDTELVLEAAPTGWENNIILLPDTRQIKTSERFNLEQNYAPQREQRTVAGITGNRIQLSQPLQFDHLGAHSEDGTINFLPHVALLDRNVTLRSENPAGVRGHVMFTGQAAVNITYTRFTGLGRTDALQDLNSTTFDANQNVTALGTNQIGRYAVHLHHLQGPANATNTGYQFTLLGNTVDAARKWGITVHGTGFGLVKDNVSYDVQGAGFMAEDGSELENEFIHNFALYSHGTPNGDGDTATGDYARGGSGFWFRRAGNLIRDNVAANSLNSGFYFNSYDNTKPAVSQAFRGADKHTPGGALVQHNNPPGIIENNEAYGVTPQGLWVTFPLGSTRDAQGGDDVPEVVFRNFNFWHVHMEGGHIYRTNKAVFDGFTLLCQAAAQDYSTGSGTMGANLGQYENANLTFRNFHVEGCRYGFTGMQTTTQSDIIAGPMVFEDGYLKNYINMIISPPKWHITAYANSFDIQRVTLIPHSNMMHMTSTPPKNIIMSILGVRAVTVVPTVVRVTDYNKEAGNNFYVYYKEQRPGHVLPATLPELLGPDIGSSKQIASPEAGLTNEQLLQKYGLHAGGGPAPCLDETTRPEIFGFTCSDSPPAYEGPPRLVAITPWNGAVVPDTWPYLRSVALGTLPEQWEIGYQRDDGPIVKRWEDDITRHYTVGQHIVRTYLIDANVQTLASTCAVISIAPNGESTPIDTFICGPGTLTIEAPTEVTVRQGETLRFNYRIRGSRGIAGYTAGQPVPVNPPVEPQAVLPLTALPSTTSEFTEPPLPEESVAPPSPSIPVAPTVSPEPSISAVPEATPSPESEVVPSPAELSPLPTL